MTSLNSKPPNVMAMWPFLDWVYIQGMKKKLGRTHTGQLKTIFNAELPISEISIFDLPISISQISSILPIVEIWNSVL